jgi:hypothetical protein
MVPAGLGLMALADAPWGVIIGHMGEMLPMMLGRADDVKLHPIRRRWSCSVVARVTG